MPISPAQLARRMVLDLDPYVWELSSAEVAARHELRVEDVLRFDLNTSPFAPAAWDAAMETARREARPMDYFDTGYAELTPLFGAYSGVPEDHIVVGAGADEVLDIIAKTFLDNGDPAVVSAPSYPMYAIVTAQLGGALRRVPLLEGFRPDVDGLLAAAAGAKLVWHCSPNSPTANATSPDDLARLVAGAPCMVVVDEAYAEFVGRSAAPLVAEHPNLVVVKTMSKAFSMAGMRLAWAVAQPSAIELLNRVRPPNSVSYVTARLGAAALRDLPSMRANVAAVLAQREPFADGLREVGATVYPSDTNFLLTGWGSPAEAHSVAAWVEARGMVVRNYADHPLLPGHLRITVRTAADNARFLAALADRAAQK
ncbi:MAG TPA: histidinol-phosphate transaminase [Candidatus Dormibacteraeota bacterium]|nr:histidinol-phosphate transaminase [Candidatus Dormibacteraeota bacterium]